MRAGGYPVAGPANHGGKIEIMISAVQLQKAAELDGRLSLRLQTANHLLGDESCQRVFPAFQDLPVQFAVERSVAAFFTFQVNDDLAAGRSRCGIEADGAAFQFECPMHRVKNFTQSELNVRLLRIEFHYRLLCLQGDGERNNSRGAKKGDS